MLQEKIRAKGKNKMKTVVFTFGRFNPPTTGHIKLVEKLVKTAREYSANYRIYLSRSQDAKKNPLKLTDKVKYLKLSAPRYKSGIRSEEIVNVFDILVHMHDAGYEKIVMVVGSDRVSEFKILIKKYNGKAARHGSYDFKEIEVVSAGDRDPDADDVSGMSASKLRALASENNFEEFKLGVSDNLSDSNAKKLFDDVRSGMQIRESVKTFSTFLNEGVYDRAVLKAFFMAGGPGSGKSYVADATIVPNRAGLKVVNSDELFERALRKANMTTDIGSLSPEDYKYAMELRTNAKALTNRRKDLYVKAKLGLLLDGTGHDYQGIKKQVDLLKELGYDVYMIFVNTAKEIAIQRNQERERKVKEEIVINRWQEVQENIGKFQNLFGATNFIIVDNNDVKEDGQRLLKRTFVKVNKLIDKPLINPVGKRWIARELEIKNTTK